MITISTKGQIISKRSGHGFFQKTNENMSHTSKNEFIFLFFGRILGLTQLFALEINRPLANSKKKLFWTNRKCVFVFQWLKLRKICVKNHEINWWKILMNSLYVCKIFFFITNCVRICFCYIVFLILISCFVKFIATNSTNLGPNFLCWISGVVSLNTWLISTSQTRRK